MRNSAPRAVFKFITFVKTLNSLLWNCGCYHWIWIRNYNLLHILIWICKGLFITKQKPLLRNSQHRNETSSITYCLNKWNVEISSVKISHYTSIFKYFFLNYRAWIWVIAYNNLHFLLFRSYNKQIKCSCLIAIIFRFSHQNNK